MDKKLMAVYITTKGGNHFAFVDTATSSDGTSAARSLAQHTVIDAEGTAGESTEAQRIIIPYMAIDYALPEIISSDAIVPEDDNCKEAT